MEVSGKMYIGSMEFVELVNRMRQAAGNTAVLRHDNLLRRIRTEIKGRLKEGTYADNSGKVRKGYDLTKAQAWFLARSYGKEVARTIHDTMMDWENTGKPAISREATPVRFQNPDWNAAVALVARPVVVDELVEDGYQPAAGEVTMTSLELVSFINSIRATESGFVPLQHKHFMEKVEIVLGDGRSKFRQSYTNSQNKQQPMYRFPKREATIMAMTYSHVVSTQVYDKMEQLERKAAPTQTIPGSFSAALLLAAAQQEQIEKQALALTAQREVIEVKEQALELAAPAVRFHDSFMKQGVSYTATDVAKKLNVTAKQVNDWLMSQGVLFANRKHFQHWYVAKGYGIEKFTPVGDDIYSRFFHTSAGTAWILANFKGKNV